MSWTAPRTYAVNEVVTATILNTDHRDNLLSLMHPHTFAGADIDVVSTVTETSLGSILVAGNSLGTQGRVELLMEGDYLHNSGASDTVTLRVKFGGVTIYNGSTNFNGLVTSNRKPWILSVALTNRVATNAQHLSGWFGHPAADAGEGSPTTGIGVLGPSGASRFSPFASSAPAAIDTTTDQTLEITAQWSASSASNSFRRRIMRAHLQQG